MADRPRHVVNHADLEWVTEGSPSGKVRFVRKRLAWAAGGEKLGCSLYRLSPRSRCWPRHAHLENEEAIFVLEGQGTLEMGGERITLSAGDYAALPVGAAHAHRVVNDSDADFVFLCMSTMQAPDVVLYPDSGKVGVFAGSPPGGAPERVVYKKYLDAAAEVPYWRDEEDT
jgi:uncharacterized cupin superfamily protein